MMDGTVNIALATFNGEKYITEMLDSIFFQTYQDFIIHLCDDGSTDDTLNKIKSHELYELGKLIVHETNGGNGALKNFRRTINHCDSDYIFLCDQDDYWKKEKIELMILEARKYDQTQPILLFSDLEIVDQSLNTISPSFYNSSIKSSECRTPQDFVVSNHIPGCSMMFNRALYKLASNMPDNIRMHDWWIAIIASYFGRVVFFNEPLIKYRQHSSNAVGVPGMNKSNPLRMFYHDVKSLRVTISRSKNITYELLHLIESEGGGRGDGFFKLVNKKISLLDWCKCVIKSKSGTSGFTKLMVWVLL